METYYEYLPDDNIGKMYIDNRFIAVLEFDTDNFDIDSQTEDELGENEVEALYMGMTEIKENYTNRTTNTKTNKDEVFRRNNNR